MQPAITDRTRPNPHRSRLPVAAAGGRAAAAAAAGERRNRYARWALHEGLREGDMVALLMRNQPDVLEIWLGLTGIGIGVAVLGARMRDAALARSLDAARPRLLIVDSGLSPALCSVQGLVSTEAMVWWHGDGADFARIDLEVEDYDGGPLNLHEVAVGAARC